MKVAISPFIRAKANPDTWQQKRGNLPHGGASSGAAGGGAVGGALKVPLNSRYVQQILRVPWVVIAVARGGMAKSAADLMGIEQQI